MWKQLKLWGQRDLSLNPSMLSPKASPLISVRLHLQTGWSPGGPCCQPLKSFQP